MTKTCTQICSIKSSTDICVSILKKLLKGRNRSDDMFKCGSCNSSFETICNLHAHCMKHSNGGSYHFDSFTATAFPKYDTTCAYTQYASKDVAVTVESDKATGKAIITETGARCTETRKRKRSHDKTVLVKQLRSSKRISGSKQKQSSDLKNGVENVEKGAEADIQNDQQSVNCALKSDGTEKENSEDVDIDTPAKNVNSRISKGFDSSDAPINNVTVNIRAYNTNYKNDSKEMPRDEELDISCEDINTEKKEDHVNAVEDVNEIEKTNVDRSKSMYKGNNENNDNTNDGADDNGDSQKKDELTATEALLEIWKGDSGFCQAENGKRASKKVLKKGKRKVRIEQPERITVKEETIAKVEAKDVHTHEKNPNQRHEKQTTSGEKCLKLLMCVCVIKLIRKV